MTKPILTRCGYRCDLCLAYVDNVRKSPENRKILSDGWHKYFGFRINPHDLICDGCLSEKPFDEIKLIDRNCPVRPCVLNKKIQNCTQCEDYICENLRKRVVKREDIEKERGETMPDEDYFRFIRPYENIKRFDGEID